MKGRGLHRRNDRNRTSCRGKRRTKRAVAITSTAVAILLATVFGVSHVKPIYVNAEKHNETNAEPNEGFLLKEEDSLFTKMAEKIKWEAYEKEVEEYVESHKVVFHTVDESYFDHTLFIGDSRTQGLSQHARLGKADYFAQAGMTVFNLFKERVSDCGFGTTDLKTLLQKRKYERIYLMLGINEIGYPMNGIKNQYEAVLKEIQALQPDATIILEANMHVARKKEKANPSFRLANIEELNQIIASFADQKQIFYIDVNEVSTFVDEEGYLRDDVSVDGVHPNVPYYKNWAQWLCENAV